MKKICFFSGDISKTGGTERVTLQIAGELCNNGYEVSILSYRNGIKPSFEYNDKINFYSLNLERNKDFFSRKIMPFIKLLNFNKKYHQDIIINVDILLANYTLPIKKFLKSKIISWEHFNFRNNNGDKHRDYARKLSSKYADYIIVLTDADLKEYKLNLDIRCPIKRIYNPIVGNVDDNKLDSNIVLASGRFTYQKNFQELISIWEKLDSRGWKLIICGSGEDFDEISKMIEDNRLENVLLPGFCDDMDEYYNRASIYVMTSRYEGFPMVLLEAQQHSIPLIAYDCFTGPSEIIENGKNGYLIDYGDREEYVLKLKELMNDSEKLKRFSEYSKKTVKKYDIKNIMNDWENLIKALEE